MPPTLFLLRLARCCKRVPVARESGPGQFASGIEPAERCSLRLIAGPCGLLRVIAGRVAQ